MEKGNSGQRWGSKLLFSLKNCTSTTRLGPEKGRKKKDEVPSASGSKSKRGQKRKK